MIEHTRTFKFIIAASVAAAMGLGAVPAYAGPVRAIRGALMGAKAAQVVTEEPGEEAAAKADANLKKLHHEQ